jgi:hypothetical protein
VCQLEGSDHGGRDSAAELALAGIDVQASDTSCNRLTLGSTPSDGFELYTSKGNSQRLCAKAISITAFLTAINGIEHDSSLQTRIGAGLGTRLLMVLYLFLREDKAVYLRRGRPSEAPSKPASQTK